MLLTEYNEAETMEMFKEEGRKEGRAEGRAEGVFDTLIALVQKGQLSVENAAAQAGVSEVVFRQRMLGNRDA